MALALCVGALPFIISARAYAQEAQEVQPAQQKQENRWLDEYSKPVGLTYGAKATFQTSYLWRGLYAGGMNVQASANVGYGGLYLDMWWNIGTTDWSFRHFQPEVDFSLGFARWGLDVFMLYIHNFDCGFFDFHNYAGKGNRLELNVCYTVSSKLPLSFRWATRVAASDGYINEEGQVVHAHSSYAEINYTHKMRDGWSIYGAFGITPWRSCYTGYKGGFAVQNIELRLRKDWSLSEHCGLMALAQMSVCPNAPLNVITLNAGVGVYLK